MLVELCTAIHVTGFGSLAAVIPSQTQAYPSMADDAPTFPQQDCPRKLSMKGLAMDWGHVLIMRLRQVYSSASSTASNITTTNNNLIIYQVNNQFSHLASSSASSHQSQCFSRSSLLSLL